MVFNRLSGLQKDLLGDGGKRCSVECKTMKIGALILLLDSTSLLHHSLEEDYEALSVEQLLKQVKAAVCPTWCSLTPNYHYGQSTHKRHVCPGSGNAFDVEIKSIADEVNKVSQGLSITDYVQSATESK
jgi:hypothetical protein